MAAPEQITMIIDKVKKAHPAEIFKRVNKIQAGIGAVLCILKENGDELTAGEISDMLNISTARVAVLLRKMGENGLIAKETSVNDARITIVRLLPPGREAVEQMQNELYSQVNKVIEYIGFDRMLEFVNVLEEIKSAIPLQNISTDKINKKCKGVKTNAENTQRL